MASITVSTTATLILDPADLQHGAGSGTECQTFIKNTGLQTVWLANTSSDASDSDGFPLDPGESMEAEVGAGRSLYGATASGSSDVRVLRL